MQTVVLLLPLAGGIANRRAYWLVHLVVGVRVFVTSHLASGCIGLD